MQGWPAAVAVAGRARACRWIGTALVIQASQLLSQVGTRACHIDWTARPALTRTLLARGGSQNGEGAQGHSAVIRVDVGAFSRRGWGGRRRRQPNGGVYPNGEGEQR